MKTTYTIVVNDRDRKMLALLEHIKKVGNVGHSFRIVVDPEIRGGDTFYWDGDGSDRIHSIQAEETP